MRISATSTGSLSGIALELERAASRAQRDAAREVSKVARKMILDDVRRSRGSLRMMGGRLGVKSKLEASAVHSRVELRAAPAGPWAIVVGGVKSYDVKPRRREVLAVSRGDIIGESAHHRRRMGRDYWHEATGRLDRRLDPIVEDIVDQAMEEAGV